MNRCPRFGASVRILPPLVAPGPMATSIFAFIQAWNGYIITYVLLSTPDRQALTVWPAGFTTLRGPVVLVFVAVHRKTAFGLTAGAVKG
ncbi:MAG: hypothetical protein ABR569_04035 [Gaiellaceae bacterium]